MVDDCIDFSDLIEFADAEYSVCSKNYILASDIEKGNFHISAADLKPDDDIELEHSLTMNHDKSKVCIVSKTITMKNYSHRRKLNKLRKELEDSEKKSK